MSEVLSQVFQEIQHHFIGTEALATLIDFFDFIGERDEVFDTLPDDQKTIQILNKIFSNPWIFESYISYIRERTWEDTSFKKEVFLYICDYFSGMTLESINDILDLPSLEEIEQDMQQNSMYYLWINIYPLNISLKQALNESVKRGLDVNSRWEVIYFIEEQKDGNLVYSFAGWFHLVNHKGSIITHTKGVEMLWKMILEKIRRYKKFLLFSADGNVSLSENEVQELEQYVKNHLDIPLSTLKSSQREWKRMNLKIRFSLASDIYFLEQQFKNYKGEIISVIGGEDMWDGEGKKSSPTEVIWRKTLIKSI